MVYNLFALACFGVHSRKGAFMSLFYVPFTLLHGVLSEVRVIKIAGKRNKLAHG
jgi:hypothetical protein